MKALVLASLLSLPLLAAGPPGPSLREVVERFDAAQAKVNTLQAPFTLTIRRALLKTPTVTKGTLYLQGSAFAQFVFSPPEDLILHLTPKALISYSPGAQRGDLLKIGLIKNADRKFLGLGQKLSYLSDYFQVGLGESKDLPNAHFLSLLPTSLSVKKRIQALQIWVDRDTYLPRQINWVERSGDSWLLELGPLTVNQTLPPAVVNFKTPAEVTLGREFNFFATRKR